MNTSMNTLPESSLESFKNFLDDSTALLVRSIQPLVSTIRSASNNPNSNPDVDELINGYIRDISLTVEEIVGKTEEAVRETGSVSLKRHALPVVKVLEMSRIELNVGRNSREGLPPVAFRIARATKVCCA
jgi:hypothetical protein